VSASLTVSVQEQTSSVFVINQLYQAPNVTAIVPDHGPVVGSVVTVLGANFGLTAIAAANRTVWFGGREAVDTQYISDSQLVVQVAADVGRYHVVRAVVANVSSDPLSQAPVVVLWRFDAPLIAAFTPTHGPSAGQFVVTGIGRNFGPASLNGDVDVSKALTVTVNNVTCSEVVRLNDTVFTCRAPAGVNANLSVVATVGYQSSREDVRFAYDEPFILSYNVSGQTLLAVAAVGGADLVVTGGNFGVAAGAAPQRVSMQFGGTQ
jgi:hypothetical protein